MKFSFIDRKHKRDEWRLDDLMLGAGVSETLPRLMQRIADYTKLGK